MCCRVHLERGVSEGSGKGEKICSNFMEIIVVGGIAPTSLNTDNLARNRDEVGCQVPPLAAYGIISPFFLIPTCP